MQGNRNRHRQLTVTELSEVSKTLKARCIWMAHKAKECHLKGALSSVDLLLALFNFWLRFDPADVSNPQRDRLIFSKGHACTSLYTVLAEFGFIPQEWLQSYATSGSPLPSHPCKHLLPLLEFSSGSLGHGLGIASGLAYACRLSKRPYRVCAVLSDGECNEGSIWEAAMFAGAQHLSNLIAIVDFNGTQSIAPTSEILGDTNLEARFASNGWATHSVNGHDFEELQQLLATIPSQASQPTAIVAHTRSDGCIPRISDGILWHYRTPSVEDVHVALAELGRSDLTWT